MKKGTVGKKDRKETECRTARSITTGKNAENITIGKRHCGESMAGMKCIEKYSGQINMLLWTPTVRFLQGSGNSGIWGGQSWAAEEDRVVSFNCCQRKEQ